MRLGTAVSFSWRRALGLSGLKDRIARKTGIPLMRGGRERKVGRLVFQMIRWVFGDRASARD
jgi:hypothetical protein